MAHGTPDWGVTAGAVTVYQLTDLAELAARLGALSVFDRRGDIFYQDGFEDGLHDWTTSVSGTAAEVRGSMVEAQSGRYSCLLVGGSTATFLAQIEQTVRFPAPTPLGLEASVFNPGLIPQINLRQRVLDGTFQTDFEVRNPLGAQTLQYLDAVGAWVTFATGVTELTQASVWSPWKLVMDPVTRQYVRFRLGQRTWSLAGIPALSAAVVDAAVCVPRIQVTSDAGNNRSVYVDDVILTQNEPA